MSDVSLVLERAARGDGDAADELLPLVYAEHLHHAATGCGTDLVGEAEVGAFELVGGCKTPIVYALNLSSVSFGLAIAPLRTLRAFWVARGARALFRQTFAYEELLATSLGGLRARLGVPREGLARAPRRLHDAKEATCAAPSAPPIGGSRLAVCLAAGLVAAASGAHALAGGAMAGLPLAALGAIVFAGALAGRRGSLGARAVTGHAALAFGVASAALGLGSPSIALGFVVALAVLGVLARR